MRIAEAHFFNEILFDLEAKINTVFRVEQHQRDGEADCAENHRQAVQNTEGLWNGREYACGSPDRNADAAAKGEEERHP